MSSGYTELLDAAITHLEALKERGVRNLPVSAETLKALSTPVARVENAPPASRGHLNAESLSRDNQPTPTVVARPVSASSFPAPAASGSKAAAFDTVKQRALACVACPHLAASRKSVVVGVGNLDARLMFVGEAPGADEDEQGEPFVGRAGELLTKVITAMGLSRADVFIGNVLKCRPDTPNQTAGNRKPTAQEMATCLPYLQEQIEIIKPQVLVALGGTAVEGLLGGTVFITKLRGQWQSYRGIPLMPTFHPSYLLRLQSNTEKRKLWEDMMAVMEKLEMPVSDRQRGYFLKG